MRCLPATCGQAGFTTFFVWLAELHHTSSPVSHETARRHRNAVEPMLCRAT